MNTVDEFGTLVELLRWRARSQPEQVVYTYLADGEREEVRVTYGELDRKARAIGVGLRQTVGVGERVVLLYPPGVEYINAFFGCLYAGAVAVPAYPPRRNRNLVRLQAVMDDADARAALTTDTILARITPQLPQHPQLQKLRWMTGETLAQNEADDWQPPNVNADSLAFLQYTSGSTSAPKGVMLGHRHLLHNERLIQAAFRQTGESIIVGWLPLYHDMGLIGNVIQPLYAGGSCILMSPVAFLQSPFRWLDAISRYGATTSGGPNFAYDLCVRKITAEQRATLDLTRWSVAFNGAEPIRHETIERFAETFADCGFRREAFIPCYGLAEATLLVSARNGATSPLVTKTVETKALEHNRIVETGEDAEHSKIIVGCGSVQTGLQLVIVDPDSLSRRLPGEVGEIWLAGASVAGGYFNRTAETEKTFHARLADDDGDDDSRGTFLRTGDLGFVDDGELFVVGRLKDLIIIRGLNHHPQDIELTVQGCHPSLRMDGGAAFSLEAAGEERLVVVQEADHRRAADWQVIIERIGEAVAEAHEVQVDAVVLIKAGSIPKTSSGKIQRHACRAAFLDHSLNVVAERRWTIARRDEVAVEAAVAVPSPDEPEAVERWLVSQLAAMLRIEADTIDVHQSLDSFGLDSLTAIELMHNIESNLRVSVPLTSFLQSPSISELVAQVVTRSEISSEDSSQIPLAASPETQQAYPLSRGQQALWFLHQLERTNTINTIAVPVRIVSALDTHALRRAFQALVNRHPALRTTFDEIDGLPIQRVQERMDVSFDEIDASLWSEAALHQRLADEASVAFDLSQGALMRVRLFKRAGDEHVLLLAIHHIVADFWSLEVLLRELDALYQSELDGTTPTLSTPAIQYADYVRWQEKMLDGDEGERLWSYWREQLGGEIPVTNLASERARPPVQTYRGASYNFKLSGALSRQLKAFAQSRGATLYTTLMAAFQTLLHRYTHQTDITVGSPVSGRSRKALAGMVGYFVNPVPVRAHPSAHLPFDAFLEQVRATVLAALQHQDFPFALLTERLQPQRDPSYSPLFQVMFILQKAHRLHDEGLSAFAVGESGLRLTMPHLTFESMRLEQRVAQFDLTLIMAEFDGGLTASFEYNTDLFDASMIVRLAKHFETLLSSIVVAPTLPLGELPLLSDAEQRLVLADWNDTATDYAHDLCLHQLFERQAARTPERIAAAFRDEQLSYRELNARANRLAHHLRSLGVGAERLVGICMERSTDMLVGVLGVLKAGGAYIPLDPAYPQDRLSFMLEDSGARVLLTQRRLSGNLPSHRAQVVCIDTDIDASDASRDENPDSSVMPENLAYLIYTSGSTGRLKGVPIPHRNVVNFLESMSRQPALTEHDVLLAVTTLSFDIAGLEIFLPLSVGARVVIVGHDEILDGAQLMQRLKQSGATVMQATPALWRLLLDAGWAGDTKLKILCGGEALPPELATELLPRCASLWNLYGPTETTIWSAVYQVERETHEPVPVGRPIANTQIYLLDARLHPVPSGVPGELHIGGDGLARGYFNQPHLTAEKFIPNPFSSDAGARMYKTGDVACYLADGNIKYLGRSDYQVKVRGFRIELGEIEAALGKHAAVQQNVVVARAEGTKDNRLIAYLVPHRGAQPTTNDLRSFLRQQLPEYMIPSLFVFLESLPLTPNGKVDRRSLPRPLRTPDDGDSSAQPQTPAEKLMAQIWSELLGIEHVRLDDNFFELGGHSLLASQLISRIRQTFRANLPLRAVFEMPIMTGIIETLARYWGGREIVEEIAQTVLEIEQLSEDHVRRMLAEQTSESHD